MRLTPIDLSSRLVLALLTALLCIAPCVTYAQTRSFQMALWARAIDDVPRTDTDIPVFNEGEDQPRGFSIMVNFNWHAPLAAHRPYDWARILAVLVDEPYNDFNNLSCWRGDTEAAVEARVDILAERAAEIKAVSPLTRFWVNLTQHQLDWVMTGQCVREGARPVDVNRPYIDVISIDLYHAAFAPQVKRYYDRLDTHRAKPDQQLALIPGTFHIQGRDNPSTQASYLQGYFDYANAANQSCNLPRGSRGLTGSFDGCPVWIVLGWLAHNHTQDGAEYVGELDGRSAAIANVWRSQLALPLRPDLAHQAGPAQLLPGILPLILN